MWLSRSQAHSSERRARRHPARRSACRQRGREGAQAARERERYWPLLAVSDSITRSRLKLPGFCRGGNSWKLWSQLAA